MRSLPKLLAALLLLVSSGCTSIPTAGPVESVPISDQALGVEIAPAPPQEGISPRRLIEGFLQAMADPEADYEVARQYLTTTAGEGWDPTSGTEVYDAAVVETDGTFKLVGALTGSLDELGRFATRLEPLDLTMALAREEGEWRIARAPEGLLVSQFMFERYYVHATIYFMSPSGDFVVPDLIHMPESLLTAERIIEAQLAGPGPGIAGSVRNALPGGTELAELGAGVDADGIARVHLTNLPDNLGEDRRRELGAQLLWSLTAIGRVTGLEILLEDVPLPLPGQNADGVLEMASQQGYQILSRAATPDLFGVREEVGGRVAASGAFVPMASDGQPVSQVAMSLDAALVAFVDETRTQVLIGPLGGQLTAVDTGVAEIRATQFVLGQLWVLGSVDGASQLVRIDSQGGLTPMDISSVEGRVTDFAASQTGTRLALVSGEGEAAELAIAGLGGGDGTAIESWTPLALNDGAGDRLTHFSGVSWSDENELAVIARAEDAASVFLVRMDGALVEDLGPIGAEPVEVTALPRMGGDTVVIRTADDTVLRYEAMTRWTMLELALSQVTYAG